MSPAVSDEPDAPAPGERLARYDMHLDDRRQVRWRLVASNGRVIARSARGHRTAADCRAELDRLRKEIAALRPRLARADTGRAWTWSVALDGVEPSAVSARAYERVESCQVSYAKFVRLLSTTEPAD